MNFAQLLGLANHLTWQLKCEGRSVYKLVPWGETEVMMAFVYRRAQELNLMSSPLDIQYDLLKHELFSRLKLS